MQQIAEEENEVIEMTRGDANQLIPSIESAYVGLQIQGKYLPNKNSSIITSEYLLKVLFEEFYVPLIEDIKIGVLFRAVKKSEVIQELLTIQLEENQQWGIDQKHQPDKQWAVNVLKTMKPLSNIFQKYNPEKYDMKNFTAEQLSKIKSLDLSKGKKGSIRRFFRISKEKQSELEMKRRADQKKRLENKVKEKKLTINEVQKEIVSITQKIQQI